MASVCLIIVSFQCIQLGCFLSLVYLPGKTRRHKMLEFTLIVVSINLERI